MDCPFPGGLERIHSPQLIGHGVHRILHCTAVLFRIAQ
jgi:hypothetical protein